MPSSKEGGVIQGHVEWSVNQVHKSKSQPTPNIALQKGEEGGKGVGVGKGEQDGGAVRALARLPLNISSGFGADTASRKQQMPFAANAKVELDKCVISRALDRRAEYRSEGGREEEVESEEEENLFSQTLLKG